MVLGSSQFLLLLCLSCLKNDTCFRSGHFSLNLWNTLYLQKASRMTEYIFVVPRFSKKLIKLIYSFLFFCSNFAKIKNQILKPYDFCANKFWFNFFEEFQTKTKFCWQNFFFFALKQINFFLAFEQKERKTPPMNKAK